MSGGAWGGNVSVSVGRDTLRATVGSYVGVAFNGSTLISWCGSSLGAVYVSSIGSFRGSGYGAGTSAILGGAVACMANILAR